MSEKLPPILLIGCGKMGGAMLSGWLEQGLSDAVVVEPHAAAVAAFTGRVRVVADAAAIPADFRPAAVVTAIKPQEAPASLPAYARFSAQGALFLTIMAGRSIASMQAALGAGTAVVRAMPNTPAAIRQGFTAAFAGPGVSAAQKALADALLAAIGRLSLRDWGRAAAWLGAPAFERWGFEPIYAMAAGVMVGGVTQGAAAGHAPGRRGRNPRRTGR
jgi:pyrroline-5-carboxylate reductase